MYVSQHKNIKGISPFRSVMERTNIVLKAAVCVCVCVCVWISVSYHTAIRGDVIISD